MDNNERFDECVKSPYVWFCQAAGLLRAAFVLWKKSHEELERMKSSAGQQVTPDMMADFTTNRFLSSYTMIAGFAIENFVKGVLVGRGGIDFSQGHLPEELKSHDLIKLFGDADVTLSRGEKQIVENAGKAILWKGRYATPLSANKISGEGFMHLASQPRNIVALFRRMVDELPADILGAGKISDVRLCLDLLDRDCPKVTGQEDKDG